MPACFAQSLQHFGPDVLVVFFVLSETVLPDLELKPYPFHGMLLYALTPNPSPFRARGEA
jgi:hypothetical protein